MRIAAGLAVPLVVSCTAILGDDFQIVTTADGGGTTSGTAGASTTSSSMGGSGGAPSAPPALSCAWELSSHDVLTSLQGSGEQWPEPIVGVR